MRVRRRLDHTRGGADLRIDIYLHLDNGVDSKLDKILQYLEGVQQKEKHMSKELDDLKAQVEAIDTVGDAIIKLMYGLSAQIATLKTDPVALQAMSDTLKKQAQDFADAAVANTPAAE